MNNKKIICIYLCMLLFIPTIPTITNTTKATINPESIMLDTDYIWNWTRKLANVTYEAYPPEEIPRGRSFGSIGGEYAKDILFHEMVQNLSLIDVHTEQIKHIENINKNYSNIFNITDYQLLINNLNQNNPYPFENPIPKKEMFIIPSMFAHPNNQNFWTDNKNLSNVAIKPFDVTKLYPFAGTYIENHFSRFSYQFISDYRFFFVGNVSYLTSEDQIPIPDEQWYNVYLLDDVSGSQEILNNLTSPAAVIIVDTGDSGIQNIEASQCNYSVVSISNANGNVVKDILNDDEIVLVDNVHNLGLSLTFTYNLEEGWWPESNFFLIDRIPDHNELWSYNTFPYYFEHIFYKGLIFLGNLAHKIAPKLQPNEFSPNIGAYLSCAYLKSAVFKVLGMLPGRNNRQCLGMILYDTNDCHYMLACPTYTAVMPFITVNNSVGQFLSDNHDDYTISGHINQWYMNETANQTYGAKGYNVMGNLTVEGNPESPIIVLSNRYDGMWGQTPGDAGGSAGILLGIIKYFKDYDIKPKYNIQFLFTTGEENGFLGAKYFNDSHNYTIKDWLILEQLTFNQSDAALCVHYSNSADQKIIETILYDSHYHDRTGYENFSFQGNGAGSEQGVASTKTDHTFCIGKDQDYRWDGWHRTGDNYTKGDCLNNTDRNDQNVSAELIWNISKYYTVNPDCEFVGSVIYTAVDSPNDFGSDDDSINATFSLKSVIPSDKIRVNATLKSWPSNNIIFWKNFDFVITSVLTEKTITVTLPPASTGAENGNYFVTLNLLNSTGRINDIALNTRVYDDTDTQTGYVHLSPRNNSIPNKPRDITGPSEIPVGEPANYTTNTTDSNLDQLQYQWAWRRDLEYLWILDTTETGPYDSGQNCTVEHTYGWCGEKKIQVRAREDFRYLFDGSPMGWDRYGTWSEWSDPHYVLEQFLTSFDMSCTSFSSAVNAQSATELPSIQQQESIYNAITCGGTEPYTYTWTFNHERYAKQQKTVNYSFDESGNYSVVLNVSDSNDYSKEFSVNVTVVNLSASFNLSIPSLFAEINENITFTDTSAVASSQNMTNWMWDFGDGTISYDKNAVHQYLEIGFYNVSLTVQDDLENTDTSYRHILVFIDETPPEIGQVNNEINVKNRWLEVIILGIFNDTESGINHTKVNITYPNGTHVNYTMNHFVNDTYWYVFNDTAQAGQYNYTVWVTDNENNTCNETGYSFVIPTSPMIVNVNASPQTVGFGGDITITATVMDNGSGIDHVSVNITYPDNSTVNLSMTHVVNETYSLFFNDTWQAGMYTYSVWAFDSLNNTDCVSGFNFTVSAEAAITVCTTKDSYTGNEFINLTDPPGNPSLPLGYELLDDGAVLHLWNYYDNYYFNTSSGIQLTNHKDEYWSHNVLMLGYYNNDQWNLLYRTDELTGFNRDIEIDESSFVNVTLWKDLSYAGYPFRLAIRYHLGVNDHDLTVIPYIKNLGTTSIPYMLGFGWELKDIQINMTTQGDYIMVDQESYYLNQTLENVYTDLNETVFYLMDDSSETQTQSLYLRWDSDLTYKLQVKSRSGQQNAPVALFIRVGTLAVGQQKSTSLQWYDASQETYYFNAFDENEAWEYDPELMTDETEETFASTRTDTTVELCNGNTCEGDDLGTIQKVELRVNGYYEGENGGTITLRPIFEETDGENYTFVAPERPEWSQWFDITNDDGRGGGGLLQWSWSEVNKLDCDVEASVGEETTLFCSIIQLRVTYNTAPSVSNPYPPHGTNGISLQPQLNITVSDPNGDTMNVTWYSNSTPSLLTLRPDANGSIAELQRYPTSENANYKCVDETIVNDNDYVYWSGTSWKKDSYNLANHEAASGVIENVTVYARCNRGGFGQDPGVPNEGKIVIRSNGSYYYGNEFTPASTFTYYSHTWSVNPATGNAWTWSAIDALEAGISFIGNEGGSSKCSQVYVVVTYVNQSTWLQFGSNSSVNNGVYRQRFLNASVNGQWWYWKVKADDGTLSTWSSVYKFYTGYQSKIENTGETDISGYLLMQVQYYNETTENWIVDNDTVNETTPRIINSSCQLGLDTIFNGQVRASDLTHGTGTYRVYAAFRDPEGNILKTNDETELEAWWQFSKT